MLGTSTKPHILTRNRNTVTRNRTFQVDGDGNCLLNAVFQTLGFHDEPYVDDVGKGLDRQRYLPIHMRRQVAVYMAR